MEPVLVIMAAGMGSRFGGLKQMTPVDGAGHVILDYAAYDAVQAGFQKIVCVIKREMEGDFHGLVGRRIAARCDLRYAFQELSDLPAGHIPPAGRVKPWGTAHAVHAARGAIDGPFAVINADDFYGRGAFQALYDYLKNPGDKHTHALVAYKLRNTLTEFGTVARGVCQADGSGSLVSVTERTAIRRVDGRPSYTEDKGQTWIPLDPDTPVSLNTWGFRKSFLSAIEEGLIGFLEKDALRAPETAEFFLPGVVNACLTAGTDRVTLLPTDEVWHGVTYKDDLPLLTASLAELCAAGVYPPRFWL